jgi:ribosomal protein L11 methyltransferase
MMGHAELIELAATVPWEASEAVENFLLEAGALGTSIERFDLEGLTETVRAYFPGGHPPKELEVSVATYLRTIEAYFPSLKHWQCAARTLVERDWQESWKRFFRPLRVTRRIVIRPRWEPYEGMGNDIVIAIDPGMAFGTGLHATTRLCLANLEREIDRTSRGRRARGGLETSLLDVGTGSGILAIAAAMLGAKPVVGIDTDPDAIEVARRNARINDVDPMVRIGSEDLEAVDGSFYLVVANIDLPTLSEIRRLLTEHVAQGGRLILSGLLVEEGEGLKATFQQGGVRFVREASREGWSCLVFER